MTPFLFAWFQTSATGKAVNASKNVGITANTYTMGDIKFTVSLGDPSGSVKLSDKDGWSYVLVNGVKTKDAGVSQNHESMFATSTLGVTATIKTSTDSEWRNATPAELETVVGKYAIKLVGSKHTKISSVNGNSAIAVDLYEKYAEGDAEVSAGTKNIGDDKESLIDGNTIYATFTVDGTKAGNELSLSFTTVYSAVQGGAGIETDETFTSAKPTITATLGTYTAANPEAATGGFSALAEAD